MDGKASIIRKHKVRKDSICVCEHVHIEATGMPMLLPMGIAAVPMGMPIGMLCILI